MTMWRRLVLARSGALILLLLAGCHRDRGAVPVGPRLSFTATSHDFGSALGGTVLVHRFAFTNTGDQTLVLGALSTSCGCTVAKPEQRQVAPGASSHIEVRFDTRGYEGETRNVVYVMSNDGRAPRTVLVITAEVELPLGFEPRSFKLLTDDAAHRTERIWLTGRYAGQTQLHVNHIEDEAAASLVAIRPIQQIVDGGVRQGVEFHLKTIRAVPGSGTVVLDTGIPDPAQMAIEFAWGETIKLRGPTDL